jgi:hypothetical protein
MFCVLMQEKCNLATCFSARKYRKSSPLIPPQQADRNIRGLCSRIDDVKLMNAQQITLVVKYMNLDVMLPEHSKNQWFLASLAPLLNTGGPGNIQPGTRYSLKNDSCDMHEALKHKFCVTSR